MEAERVSFLRNVLQRATQACSASGWELPCDACKLGSDKDRVKCYYVLDNRKVVTKRKTGEPSMPSQKKKKAGGVTSIGSVPLGCT